MGSALYMFVKRFYFFELVYYTLWGLTLVGSTTCDYAITPAATLIATTFSLGNSSDGILDMILFKTWPLINELLYGGKADISILAGTSLI